MKTLPTIVILSLSVLLILPATLPRAHAVLSNGNNYWSAYGPSVDNLLFKVYTDFSGTFSDFNAGQLDMTDWTIQAADLQGFINNPDFFVTSPQGDFGIFELDINHHMPFLTIATQAARTTSSPSLTINTAVACGVTCPSNTFQLIVSLINQEEGNTPVKDVNNFVTATVTGSSSAAATKADDANPTPAGTYTLPPLSNVPASYKIATSIYAGSLTLFTSGTTQPVCPANDQCTATLAVNYNSGSTQKPTAAGIFIARALAHLLDKPNYLTGSYLESPQGALLGNCLDVFAPAAQGLMSGGPIGPGSGACDHNSAPAATNTAAPNPPSSGFATINAELSDHPWFAGTPVSLYNLSPDTCTGTVTTACPVPGQAGLPFTAIGYSGVNDLRAACDYFELAGFHDTGAGGTGNCLAVAQGTQHLVNPAGSCNTGTGVGCVIFFPRTHPPRMAFGAVFGDTLNYLFGTPAPTGGTVCYGGPPNFSCSIAPKYFTIAQVGSTVFGDGVTPDTWNIYTGGYTLGSTPDHLWSLDSSQFASTFCGGAKSTFPNNYRIYCDPAFDSQATAGEFGIGYPAFQAAAVLGATRGELVSVYAGINQYVGLNAWNFQASGSGTGSGLVSVKGHGFEAGTSFELNAKPVPGYVPSNSLYYASGCNPTSGCEQNVLRRSMSQTTLHMSPYTATTAWEFDPLIQFYDSMLATDPNTGGLCQTQPGGTNHCIDWMTTSHSFSFDPSTNHLTQTWNLRSDIYFSDGVPVTAHDVCFSILSYRDAPSANFLPSVSNVVSCTAVASNIAQVVLTGNSPFSELNIGGLFILPEHIWTNQALVPGTGGLIAGTDQVVTPSALANGAFDPVAAGIMVGSGPWMCNPSAGVSTISGQASCSQNADGSAGGQALSNNGRMLLKRNIGYMRGSPNAEGAFGKVSGGSLKTTDLQALAWADSNKDGKVTILDIAAAAAAFGTTNAYFAHPMYSVTPGTVDIGDIATMASFFDHGTTSPFVGTAMSALLLPPGTNPGLNPQIDPYQIKVGSDVVYYQGTTITGGTPTAHWAVLAGTPTVSAAFYNDGTGSIVIPGDGGGHGVFSSSSTAPVDVVITVDGQSFVWAIGTE